jgi:hypothetical protein
MVAKVCDGSNRIESNRIESNRIETTLDSGFGIDRDAKIPTSDFDSDESL